MVRDARQVDAHPLGDLCVGVAGLHTRAHEPGQIERRQAVTLLVLGDLGVDVMGLRADDDGDCLEPRPFCRTQAFRAEDNPVATRFGCTAHDDGLKNSAHRDVSGELGDFPIRELGPRVGGIFLEAIDGSLTRLGVDHVDLYQIHRFDDETPVEETMEALHDTVKAGKARYIGESSMYAWQFAKLQHAADLGGWTRFVSMQNQYNLLRRHDEPELIPMWAGQSANLARHTSATELMNALVSGISALTFVKSD